VTRSEKSRTTRRSTNGPMRPFSDFMATKRGRRGGSLDGSAGASIAAH
jgi:hypothetical protein